MEKTITTLKKRVKVFKKLIKDEDLQIERLKYKSRSIRLNNSHVPRKNWYIDRLQELQLIISFLEGKTNESDFIHHKLDDGLGGLCQLVGNLSKHND